MVHFSFSLKSLRNRRLHPLIGFPINEAFRTVTGCLRLTPAANLPILSGIQPADFRRNGATLSLTPRAMKLGPLLHAALTRLSSVDARLLKSRHPYVPAAQELISSSDNNNSRAAHWADHQWDAEWADNPTKLCIFIPNIGTNPGVTLPRTACVRLNHLCTGVGRFRSCLYKWGMASSAACECGAEEQTFDHVVLQCPIHRPPHGLHGLAVLDDETIEWLFNTFPKI